MGGALSQLYLFLAVIVLVMAVVGFYYIFELSIPETYEAPKPVITPPPAEVVPTIIEIKDPEFNIYIGVKDKRTVVIQWKYLPEGTNKIKIYRSKNGGPWIYWKTIDLSSTSGQAELRMAVGENANNYTFYAEGLGDEGTTWTSPPITASTSTPPTSGTNPPPAGPNPNPPPAGPPPPGSTSTPTSTPPPNPPPPGAPSSTPPDSTPTSTPPPPPGATPSSTTTGTVNYYNPDGTPAGNYTPPPDTFWVQHVNNNIEMGWQNLPVGTTNVVINRSTGEDGPWTTLLIQQSPDQPGLLRVVDSSINAPHYYQMQARAGSSVLATYGPVLLEALVP